MGSTFLKGGQVESDMDREPFPTSDRSTMSSSGFPVSPAVSPEEPLEGGACFELPAPQIASRKSKLEQRLSGILRGLVRGLRCDAADFYRLNAASDTLHLWSHYQPDSREPGDATRSLDAAEADVAAMAGNVVVLEHDAAVAEWPVPVWCGAAVCLPVASDQNIYGTLWLYCDHPREFSDETLDLAEVVAGRVAAELEIDAWRRSQHGETPADVRLVRSSVPVTRTPVSQEIPRDVSRDVSGDTTKDPPPGVPPKGVAESTTQQHRSMMPAPLLLPKVAPLLEEWELAGWTDMAVQQHSFYDWQSFPDGRTLVIVGAVCDGLGESTALLPAARMALRAHASDSEDAGELLTRLNQTLWMASPGGEGISLAVAFVGACGGQASLALAGTASSLRWRASSGQVLAASGPPVGWAEQTLYISRQLELQVRERVVLVASPGRWAEEQPLEQITQQLGHLTADQLRSLSAKRALHCVLQAAEECGSPLQNLVLVRRR